MTQPEPDSAPDETDTPVDFSRVSLKLALRLFETLDISTLDPKPLLAEIINAAETIRPTFADDCSDVEVALIGALVDFVTVGGGGMAVLLDRTLEKLPDDRYPNSMFGFEGARAALIQGVWENPDFKQVLTEK